MHYMFLETTCVQEGAELVDEAIFGAKCQHQHTLRTTKLTCYSRCFFFLFLQASSHESKNSTNKN